MDVAIVRAAGGGARGHRPTRRDLDVERLRILRHEHADPERRRKECPPRGRRLGRVVVVSPAGPVAQLELLVSGLVLPILDLRLVRHEEPGQVPARRRLRQYLGFVRAPRLRPDEVQLERLDEPAAYLVGVHLSSRKPGTIIHPLPRQGQVHDRHSSRR
jgi:hypothetical protein